MFQSLIPQVTPFLHTWNRHDCSLKPTILRHQESGNSLTAIGGRMYVLVWTSCQLPQIKSLGMKPVLLRCWSLTSSWNHSSLLIGQSCDGYEIISCSGLTIVEVWCWCVTSTRVYILVKVHYEAIISRLLCTYVDYFCVYVQKISDDYF